MTQNRKTAMQWQVTCQCGWRVHGTKARETNWRQSRLDIKSRAVVVALVDLRAWVLERYPR